MKQHFIKINHYQPKNQAHKEVLNFVSEYNNCLIDEQRLDELSKQLHKFIETVNAKYPRCQDIAEKSWSHTPGHATIAVEGIFYMDITQVKRFELSKQEGVTE